MLHLTLPSTLTTGPVNGPQTKTPSGLRQAIRELLIITKKLARGETVRRTTCKRVGASKRPVRDTEVLMAELPTPQQTKCKGPTINNSVPFRQRRRQNGCDKTPHNWMQPNPDLYTLKLGTLRKKAGVQMELEVTLGRDIIMVRVVPRWVKV